MDAVRELVGGFDGRVAVYGRHPDSGEEVVVGDVDRRFPAGSAAKQPAETLAHP